jgi:ankyrin repeat protein
LIAALDAEEYGAISIPVVQRLLAVDDIDVNLADKKGLTPLMHAVIGVSLPALELLLAKPGIEINQQNAQGNTALMIALNYRYVELARRLLALPNINPNIINENEQNALQIVQQDPAYPAREEIIALLRARGAQ